MLATLADWPLHYPYLENTHPDVLITPAASRPRQEGFNSPGLRPERFEVGAAHKSEKRHPKESHSDSGQTAATWRTRRPAITSLSP
eukprot:755352-Hanusia_phi.AAC.6